jgi:hypothetical protein
MRQVIALVGCLTLFLQGCTAMQAAPVAQAGSTTPSVHVEDTPETTTRADEVKQPQKERKRRTILWTVGGVVLAIALIAAGGGGGSSY